MYVLEDFVGEFPGGFLWAHFPTKMRRKNRQQNPRKKSGGSKQKTTNRKNQLCEKLGCRKWGCNKWGLKGCLAALPGNRPKSAKIALLLPLSPFSGGCQEHLGNPENGGKRLFFLRYPRISLNPHLLNPHLRHPKRKKKKNRP